MEGRRKSVLLLLGIFLAVLLSAGWYMHTHNVAVLNPKGLIAAKERRLIVESTLLMLIVVIPVYVLLFYIVWRYREDNHKAKYSPDWDGDRRLEFFWWALPMVIIIALGVLAYKSSHELDPFKPLSSSRQPLTVQVVALQWKWLFIYPQHNIAAVNFVQFPTNTPINFEITSDAPMNSFWIPQLGGQIYAMSGMSTQLHLVADTTGSYRGLSANISGSGFANMKFTAKVSSASEFANWTSFMQQSNSKLNLAAYNSLAQPNDNQTSGGYALVQPDLYSRIIRKYTRPAPTGPGIDYYVAQAYTEAQ